MNPETPETDAAEQESPADEPAVQEQPPGEPPVEADPADVAEQRRVVPDDEERERD
ncbi:hypothetical protein ACL03H_03380 [Saccharopolyspora sp. MS10]|uniref:hypothetical protein n=1 Tax=Saccharopolyspora sp. MS10 TaxID=3385973 RepID=UPI00399FD052